MSIKTKSSKILPYVCEICEAPAKYSYFGVLSCQSCKIFFRRNAERNKTAFVCDSNGQCEVHLNNRHVCKACRLAKCFKCGMSPDKFRGSIPTNAKTKALVKVQVKHQLERFPTLNLLRSDQSLLTTDQWTLLSNLFYCYNESQISPFTQRLIETHRTTQSTYVMYEALVEEFLVAVYEASGAYLRSNDNLRKLSYGDRSIMLRSAADNVWCMGGSFIMQNALLYGLEDFLTIMNKKYGKRTMDIHISARKFIDPDVVLDKLAISLFAFSENTCCYYLNGLNDLTYAINIFEIQSKYADITWKYLLYKYGYYAAIKRFLNLTLWLRSMNVLAVHAQSLATHLNDIDSIIEQTEMTLILDDADEIMGTNQ